MACSFDYRALSNGSTVSASFLSGSTVPASSSNSPHADWHYSGLAEFRHAEKCNDLDEPGLVLVPTDPNVPETEGYAGFHEATGIYTRYRADADPSLSFPRGDYLLKVTKIRATRARAPTNARRVTHLSLKQITVRLDASLEKERRRLKLSRRHHHAIMKTLAELSLKRLNDESQKPE